MAANNYIQMINHRNQSRKRKAAGESDDCNVPEEEDRQDSPSSSVVMSMHTVDKEVSNVMLAPAPPPDLDVILEGIGGTHSGNVLLNDLINLHSLRFLARYSGKNSSSSIFSSDSPKGAAIFSACCDIMNLLLDSPKILVAGEKRLGRGEFIPAGSGSGNEPPKQHQAASQSDVLGYIVSLFIKALSEQQSVVAGDHVDTVDGHLETWQEDFTSDVPLITKEELQQGLLKVKEEDKGAESDLQQGASIMQSFTKESGSSNSKPQEAPADGSVVVTKKLGDSDVAILHSVVSDVSSAYKYRPGNKRLRYLLDKACREVSFSTKSSAKRARIALSIVNQIRTAPSAGSTYDSSKSDNDDDEDDKNGSDPEEDSGASCGRFLLRSVNGFKWTELDYIAACEVVTISLWRKTGDKSNIIGAARVDEVEADTIAQPVPPSVESVPDPTEHDVLFGRGGMTNHHPGNRRFRDIISLHRPDYISAIKIDKPKVARRIVQAIRAGSPPGRFLKKNNYDGLWYDVGDRTAAEKASQALRERPQAERYEKVLKRREEERRRKAEQNVLKPNLQPKNFNTMPSSQADVTPVHPQLTVAAAAAMRSMNANHHPGSYTLVYAPVFVPTPQLTQTPDLALDPSTSSSSIRKRTKQNEQSLSIQDETSVPVPGPTSQAQQLRDSGTPKIGPFDENGNVIVTEHDILCGRGGLTNHHVGNKRFRDIVSLHRPDYMRAPKVQKPAVARLIVSAIRSANPPGRFLKKDFETGLWYDIGDKSAAEKASQALREKTAEEKNLKSLTKGRPLAAKEFPDNLQAVEPHSKIHPCAGKENGSLLRGSMFKKRPRH